MKASEGSSSSDDSSSSDEEESARLKEVVEESLGSMKDAKPFTKQDKSNSEQKQNKPSLRNVSQWDDIQNEDLQTTPEFRSFLSKRLSKHLDGLITTTNEMQQRDKPPDGNIGVKLLNSSSSFVDIKTSADFQNKRPKKRRMPSVSSSDSEEEANRLSEAAVSLDFIMTNASALQGSPENSKRKDMEDKGNTTQNDDESHVDRGDGIDNKKVKKSKERSKKNIPDNRLAKEDTCLLTTNGLTLQENRGQRKEIVIKRIEVKGIESGNVIGDVPLSKGVKKQKKKNKEQTDHKKVDDEGNRILTSDCSIVKKNKDKSSKIRTGKDLLQRNDNENVDNFGMKKVKKKKRRKKEEQK